MANVLAKADRKAGALIGPWPFTADNAEDGNIICHNCLREFPSQSGPAGLSFHNPLRWADDPIAGVELNSPIRGELSAGAGRPPVLPCNTALSRDCHAGVFAPRGDFRCYPAPVLVGFRAGRDR